MFILGERNLSQVGSAIVQAVSVNVVHFLVRMRAQDQPMEPDIHPARPSGCPECVGRAITSQNVSGRVRYQVHIRCVDDCLVALGQRDVSYIAINPDGARSKRSGHDLTP